jgi:MSHA biogenesis protein MshL
MMKSMSATGRIRHLLAVAMLGGGLAVGGCSLQQPRPVTLPELESANPRAILAEAKPRVSPGPPPLTEKMAPLSRGLTPEARLYSLVFDRAPLSEVIAALIGNADLSLSVDANVDLARPVTVHLKQATLEEALDIVIAQGGGYAWQVQGGCLHVKRFQERIYHLDYLDLVGETDIEVGGDMLASSVENSGVAGKYQVKAKRSGENSDLWVSIADTLEGLKSEEGVLRINRNAGMIYIADLPRRVSTMVGFLDSLSESLHRQVFIEARIMEVILNDEHKYGIDWTNLQVEFTSSWGALPDQFDIGFNSNGVIALADQSRFSAVLDFLRTQGDVSVLSNPHLSVMNRQSAVLTVGSQFPFTDIDGVDRDFDTGVTTIGTSIKRVILGLQLGLTPQISQEGIVTLHVVPTITRIQREVELEIPTDSFFTQTISNPVIDLQELATMVRVREGQSFILAGLISEIRQLKHRGLPLLGDLPYLGPLFQQIQESAENRELVIFITPYIKSLNLAAGTGS